MNNKGLLIVCTILLLTAIAIRFSDRVDVKVKPKQTAEKVDRKYYSVCYLTQELTKDGDGTKHTYGATMFVSSVEITNMNEVYIPVYNTVRNEHTNVTGIAIISFCKINP